jgi:hypothetical protein
VASKNDEDIIALFKRFIHPHASIAINRPDFTSPEVLIMMPDGSTLKFYADGRDAELELLHTLPDGSQSDLTL